MHPIQDLFLEGFSYVLQIDMHFICTPLWTKFYSCKKWVVQNETGVVVEVEVLAASELAGWAAYCWVSVALLAPAGSGWWLVVQG
jgi:hypothetical protein